METAAFENPLREGLRLERTPESCIVVIFGASGDLTKRKLVPSLYSLARQNLLPSGFSIVGTARTAMTHEEFRSRMKDAINQFSDAGSDPDIWENFAAGMLYHPTNINDRESFKTLRDLLCQIDQQRGTSGNWLFYLSTPPALYAPITQMLGAVGLNRSHGWTRIIIEKPFGRDLESMRALNRFEHVSYERVLSGSGLFNIYSFLRDSGYGKEPPWLTERLKQGDPGAAISMAALGEESDLCVKALDLFVSIYGAEAGNLALKVKALGGLYVGGGIAPKIINKLRDGTFVRGFCDKSRLSSLMEAIPIRVILNPKTALLGAAYCATLV